MKEHGSSSSSSSGGAPKGESRKSDKSLSLKPGLSGPCIKTPYCGMSLMMSSIQLPRIRLMLVVKLLSHGCSIQAIVFAFGLDEMESLSLNEMRWNRRFH